MAKIKKTNYYSHLLGKLPKGCQYCVRGSKLVLFVTGVCPCSCFYCPISDQKYKKDVTYADEWPTQDWKDILKEAELIKAEGAGLTGGDPLAKLERTLFYIRKLKKEFGKKFHIHLYTSFDLANELNLRKLYQAGLDEIRFHPDSDNPNLWPKIKLARKHNWKIGIEIPIIPDKKSQIFKLLEYFKDKVDFINLNELEIAEAEHNQLIKLGYQPAFSYASSVKGSAELGQECLKHLSKDKINAHFCTAKLKDRVQLANRLKRRAKQARKKFDLVLRDGLLKRGALYLPELAPSFGYRKKLEETRRGVLVRSKIIRKLNFLKKKITKELKLKDSWLFLDKQKLRLLLSEANLREYQKYFKNLGLKPAIVKEYPTFDQLEVEIEFL